MDMSRTVRGTSWFVVAVLAVVIAAPTAHAIQSSGSILLVPSKQSGIIKDEQFTVDVYFRNTSTQTPPLALDAAAATLAGPITIDLGCTDCGCTQQNTSALTFIPGADAGCVTRAPGVTSCAAGGAGEVLINLDPPSLALAASDVPVLLATIRLELEIDDAPPLGLRAGTGVCALQACNNGACVSCAAEGCTFVAGFTIPEEIERCKHSCLNTVDFRPNDNDKLTIQGVVKVDDPAFDPAAESFTATLSYQGNVVATISVPGGIPKSGNKWMFSGPGNANTPGIQLIQIFPQTGPNCQNSYKVTVRFFGDLGALENLPEDNPVLTVTIKFDDRPPFESTKEWSKKANGDLFADFDGISAC